ncbi:MAG: DUF3667 domain-containing protein [Cytophagales bacterium]|jgi:hypothetical protein|nr:DUF3667 domain-containing protein [Cytophagales bacterium]MCA6386859.1 DUF3667 domain-containing protein [Cytophagales bacterium]MCA6390840.1 DUF3667 domain-containing protein [Cytophagales bacterium]MCA6396614.1 DUF3667 domain-containing protein [Cytophagales bacterium]MCA6397544.1 DUF3667 domain-containing protein [Cytophagales bacterium]
MKFDFFKKKQDMFDFEVTRICKVCSNTFHGRYCNVCGEKVSEPYERSFLNFLDSLLNAFTFLDGKFIKSLTLLITRPGQLSRNIADGLRVPYMKMVSLFFVANFFYFLFPVFDTYNSSLKTQLNYLGQHSVRAKEIVSKHIKEKSITIEEFQRSYHEKSTNLSKLLIVFLVLMLSGIFMIVNYSRTTYFFDHLLFALEVYSFQLLINLVLLANGFLFLIKGANYFGFDWRIILSDMVFSAIAQITICYFIFRGQMIFYRQKWYWSILRAIIIYYLIFETVFVYRAGLFYVTMWFM